MQQLAALWSAFQGKKTYLLSALAALWPLLAPLLGQSGTFDLQSVLIALAIAALRAGIASSNPVAAGVLTLLPKLQPLLKELEARGPEAEKFLEQLLAAAKDLPQPPAPAPDVVPFDPNALRPGGGTPLRSLLLFAFLCLPISGHCASPKAVIKGPRTAVPGEFLRYDFGSSTGMKGFRLEIDPKNDRYEQVRLLKAEKAAEVASFKGVYKLTLTVWDEQDDSDVAEWIVAIADRSKDLWAALVQWCGAKLARHLVEAGSQSLKPGHGVIGTRSLPPMTQISNTPNCCGVAEPEDCCTPRRRRTLNLERLCVIYSWMVCGIAIRRGAPAAFRDAAYHSIYA